MSHTYKIPKAILFDMDGVLFDSMPYHAEAWYRTMSELHVECDKEDFYLYEGCTGPFTINTLFNRTFGREATLDEQEKIYKIKSDYFNQYPEPLPICGAIDVVNHAINIGAIPHLVTGSGQMSLIERLDRVFPDVFPRHKIVCAYDVTHGKPHPEPYQQGLIKAGCTTAEAIVIENAPMGVKSGKAAGIFTIAVNTGPLPDAVLQEYGADIILPSMSSMIERWDEILMAYNTASSIAE